MNDETLRQEFPVATRWAFLDHAAVAPISGPARQALMDYAEDLSVNGSVHEHSWFERVEEVRRLAARLLQAEDPKDIAFVKNTSEGIAFVAEGYPWSPGDNVVIASEEYPSNVYPWLNLATRGVEVRRAPTRDKRIWIDDIRKLMDGKTRLVSLSFVEFASGFRNDLVAIGELCRERRALFFVDAIQGLGVLPLDVRQGPIDFLCADGHKWLLGPEGAGVFYVRREHVDRLRPVSVGWHSVIGATNFSQIDFRLKPHAGRWEAGSLNVGGIVALGASMRLLLGFGIDRVWANVRALTDSLCEQAQRLDWEIHSSRREGDASGIVSLSHPAVDPHGAMARCKQAGVVVNVRGGRLRVSPHAYNTPEEINRVIEVLRSA